jgi:multidrug resistance protein
VSARAGGAAQAADSSALINQQPLGAIHYRIMALCFAAWLFDFYDLILYSFLLVPVARELHLSNTQSSLLLGIAFLMTAAGGILFGFLGDRFGRKPIVIATVSIYGIGTLLCATSHSLGELLAYRSLAGLGIGGGWASGQALVAESMPPEHRGRYAGYVQTGAPLGVLLAAAVSAYLTPQIGWRWVFVISALPALIVALLEWRFLPESDVWMRSGKRSFLAAEDVRAFREHSGIIALLFVWVLLNSEAYWFTYSWMPGYLQMQRGLSERAASHLMIYMQYGGVFGYAVFGVLADRFGRRPMFALFSASLAVGLLPATILWPQASRVPGLIVAAIIVGGFGTGLWSGAAPYMSELLPTRVRNSAMGLLLNLTRGFQFFTPLAITGLGRHVGLGAALSLGALFSAAGAIAIWTLPETRGRSITELDERIDASEPAATAV